MIELVVVVVVIVVVVVVVSRLYVLQESGDYSRLIGTVFIGNEAAALSNSTTNNFTHLLCVSEELDQPEDCTEESGVSFLKVSRF